MKTLLALWRNSRELVVIAPLAALLLVLALWGVSGLTGRPVAVSLVPLVEFAISLVRVATCGAFAAMFQASCLGYRAEKSGGSLADDIHDAWVFIVLFITILVSTAVF